MANELIDRRVAMAGMPASAADTAAGSAGAACTLTLAGVPEESHVIAGVSWSFSVAPAVAPLITVKDGTTVVRQWYAAPAAGPDQMPCFVKGTAGAALVITVAAPGGSVIATANAEGHRLEDA